jgi:hypothetical protein
VHAVDPHVDVVDVVERACVERGRLPCHAWVSRTTLEADNPAPEPKKCSNTVASW